MKVIINLLVTFLLMVSCNTQQDDKKELTIAVASSAQMAMHEIALAFEKKYKTKVKVITGSSGRLVTQIVNGAPFDIFISANKAYANYLFDKKRSLDKPIIIGSGALIVWSLDSNSSLKDLETGLDKIAVASPKHAPYGQQAIQFLKEKKLYEKLSSRLVYAENISQVNEYVSMQMVKYGFTSSLTLLNNSFDFKGRVFPLDTNQSIAQVVVALKNTKNDALKQLFISFIISKEGHNILIKNGYTF